MLTIGLFNVTQHSSCRISLCEVASGKSDRGRYDVRRFPSSTYHPSPLSLFICFLHGLGYHQSLPQPSLNPIVALLLVRHDRSLLALGCLSLHFRSHQSGLRYHWNKRRSQHCNRRATNSPGDPDSSTRGPRFRSLYPCSAATHAAKPKPPALVLPDIRWARWNSERLNRAHPIMNRNSRPPICCLGRRGGSESLRILPSWLCPIPPVAPCVSGTLRGTYLLWELSSA